MEKQRSKSISKPCRRLLTVLFTATVFSLSLSAQTITASEINLLRIKPSEDQKLFTKDDLKFEVTIPKIKPSQVQVMSAQLPPDVSFKTFRKMEDYEEGGTKIEFWYNFDKKGTYQLPAVPVMIQNKRRSIKFVQITVDDDPAKQIPRIVIQFNNGSRITSSDEQMTQPVFNAQVGKKLSFTVYLQYSSQLVQFSWDLPKDSIFTQTKQYDITEVRYREKNYTHDLIPVANFEWTALKTGIQPVPKIKITATAYNGYRNELLLPETFINFTEGKISTASAENNMFDAAFRQAAVTEIKENGVKITDESCLQLATLYSEERNAMFTVGARRKARMEYENSLGLPSTSQGDFTVGLIHIIGIILITLIVFLILAIRHKRKFSILVISVLICCTLVALISQLVKHNKVYAICKGCRISSVPEEKAEAVSEIGAGNKVLITEQAGKWCYIEFGETGGWCLKDNVIIIK